MKYIVVLGDGMADYPVPELNNKTPLQSANKPAIDELARRGIMGMVSTVPAGMSPGSDTANLSVMGYDPRVCYSGRSPFEAASMGIAMEETDVSFRCNVVTLSEAESYEEKTMLDHSADEISSEEARELIAEVNSAFSTDELKFYAGISYRHLLTWAHGPYQWRLTPPHDIIGRKVGDYLPDGIGSEIILDMMQKSVALLKNHEVNKARIRKGLKPGNAIWIWGEGKKPRLDNFYDKYKLKGAVISAVDLIKGIAFCAGMESIDVEGATGNIHTNFEGKANAALAALQNGRDFVYIHLEAPDECGHRQEVANKVRAIELIDEKVVRILKDGLDKAGERYKIMVLPDHATPLALRTHTADPVPFVIYQSDKEFNHQVHGYDEFTAQETGLYLAEGHTLMDFFLGMPGGKEDE